MNEPDDDTGYQLFMLGLSVYVIGALAAQTFLPLSSEAVSILDVADFGICLLFGADFVRSIRRADNIPRYLATWGWLDLISSIPTVDLFRWGRAARIFRIVRVLRVARATRQLSTLANPLRMRNAGWTALFLAILLVISGSIAIVHLETGPNSNIRDADDAIWWTLVTVSTVGYGDLYPVSPGGRIVALGLMAVGIGLFGAFTAIVAARFVEADRQTEEALARIEQQLVELRAQLHQISSPENQVRRE